MATWLDYDPFSIQGQLCKESPKITENHQESPRITYKNAYYLEDLYLLPTLGNCFNQAPQLHHQQGQPRSDQHPLSSNIRIVIFVSFLFGGGAK